MSSKGSTSKAATPFGSSAGSRRRDSIPLPLAERLLTVAEVAYLLHMTRSNVYHMIRFGGLPSFRLKGSVRIAGAAVRRYMQRHQGRVRRWKGTGRSSQAKREKNES